MKRLLALGSTLAAATIAAAVRGEPPDAPARLVASGRSDDASVSVGVVSDRGNVRSELAGFVSVVFPFDRLAAPRALAAARDDAEPAPGDDSAAAGDSEDGDGDDDLDPPGGLRPALAPAALARLARAAIGKAAGARRFDARERDLDGVAARARASAALPELRLRAARSRDQSLRLAPTVDDPYRYSLAGGDGTLLEAQATFHLGRLVFADEELPVERLRLERERVRERLEARVLERVLAWHRALSRERGAPDPEVRGRAALERVASEVALDVLTDGWFGAEVRRLGLARPGVERRDPGPKSPAAPEPAPRSKASGGPTTVAGLDLGAPSAKPRSPCLPRLATDSRTFCGASMR